MHKIWKATIAITAGLLVYYVTHHGVLARGIQNAYVSVITAIQGGSSTSYRYNLFAGIVRSLIFGPMPLAVTLVVYGMISGPHGPQAELVREGGLWQWRKLARLALTGTWGTLMGIAVGSLFIYSGLRFDPKLFLAVAVGSVTSLGAFYLLMHRAETSGGHCRQCGYNLAGLREERCPECGTPFTKTEHTRPT